MGQQVCSLLTPFWPGIVGEGLRGQLDEILTPILLCDPLPGEFWHLKKGLFLVNSVRLNLLILPFSNF